MKLNILVMEAYDGGSHGSFLDGLINHSSHNYVRLSLPPRKWKWRMRGSAIWFSRELRNLWPKDAAFLPDSIDLIFTSDMTSVSDLKALLPVQLRNVPVVCYFHENQLTYPLSDNDEIDYQYGFTNITSALSADAVWFNSEYNRSSFLGAADELLAKMPDFVPGGVADDIRRDSVIMPLGLSPGVFEIDRQRNQENCPVILWNHRWEFDKQPEVFFDTLYRLDDEGVNFKLIVAGESFRTWPPAFDEARDRLAGRILHYGYAESRDQYYNLLGVSDIVVSTAIHEFFGLSVMEAVAAGCVPLLPNRLSYPYLIPQDCHERCIYGCDQDLYVKLKRMVVGKSYEKVEDFEALRAAVRSYSWEELSRNYDAKFVDIAQIA